MTNEGNVTNFEEIEYLDFRDELDTDHMMLKTKVSTSVESCKKSNPQKKRKPPSEMSSVRRLKKEDSF